MLLGIVELYTSKSRNSTVGADFQQNVVFLLVVVTVFVGRYALIRRLESCQGVGQVCSTCHRRLLHHDSIRNVSYLQMTQPVRQILEHLVIRLVGVTAKATVCLLYTSPSPRD